jgi:FOG: TPR repeat, SEL1 subfamily
MNHRRAIARKRTSQLLFLFMGMTLMLDQATIAAPKKIDAANISRLLGKAQAGSVSDQVELADAYANGVNGPPNMGAAAQWYRKAADAGDPCAQTSLGVL